MAIVLPDVIIFNTIEGILGKIKYDWDNQTNQADTILYKLFNGLTLGNKYDMFEQAQELFLRDDIRQDKIELRVGYDSQRAQLPTVYINLPQEQGGGRGVDSLGVNVGEGEVFDTSTQTYKNLFQRSFSTSYSIVVMSPNRNEVVLMYNAIKALLIPLLTHLEHSGLQNPTISGRELHISDEIVPQNIYIRAIGLDFFYNQVVEDIFSDDYVTNIIFNGSFST